MDRSASAAVPRTGVQRFAAQLLSSSDFGFWSPAQPGQFAVVTDIVLMNWSGAEGNHAAVFLNLDPAGTVGLVGGEIGAGQFDNWHYSGECQVNFGEDLAVIIDGGEWSVVVSGYYAPPT